MPDDRERDFKNLTRRHCSLVWIRCAKWVGSPCIQKMSFSAFLLHFSIHTYCILLSVSWLAMTLRLHGIKTLTYSTSRRLRSEEWSHRSLRSVGVTIYSIVINCWCYVVYPGTTVSTVSGTGLTQVWRSVRTKVELIQSIPLYSTTQSRAQYMWYLWLHLRAQCHCFRFPTQQVL